MLNALGGKIRKGAYLDLEGYSNIRESIDWPVSDIVDCSLSSNRFLDDKYYDFSLGDLAGSIDSYNYETHLSELASLIVDRYSNIFDVESVFFGHGCYNIVERLFLKLIRPGVFVGFSPQFLELPNAARRAGFDVVMHSYFTLDHFVENIDSMLDSSRVACVYIDNPNNPTGNVIDLSVLARLADFCSSQDIILIVDEAFGDYIDDSNSALGLAGQYSNLVVVRSFSKAYGLPSIRVGYSVVSQNLIPYMRRICVPFEPSLPSVLYAIEAISRFSMVRGSLVDIRRTKIRLISSLEQRGYNVLASSGSVPIFTFGSYGVPHLFRDLINVGVLSVGVEKFFDSVFSCFHHVRINTPPTYGLCDEFLNRLDHVSLS